jgi:hypothetical protein
MQVLHQLHHGRVDVVAAVGFGHPRRLVEHIHPHGLVRLHLRQQPGSSHAEGELVLGARHGAHQVGDLQRHVAALATALAPAAARLLSCAVTCLLARATLHAR